MFTVPACLTDRMISVLRYTQQLKVYLELLCDSETFHSLCCTYASMYQCTNTQAQIGAACPFISAFLRYQSAALCWMQRKAAESRSEQFERVGGEGRGERKVRDAT